MAETYFNVPVRIVNDDGTAKNCTMNFSDPVNWNLNVGVNTTTEVKGLAEASGNVRLTTALQLHSDSSRIDITGSGFIDCQNANLNVKSGQTECLTVMNTLGGSLLKSMVSAQGCVIDGYCILYFQPGGGHKVESMNIDIKFDDGTTAGSTIPVFTKETVLFPEEGPWSLYRDIDYFTIKSLRYTANSTSHRFTIFSGYRTKWNGTEAPTNQVIGYELNKPNIRNLTTLTTANKKYYVPDTLGYTFCILSHPRSEQ